MPLTLLHKMVTHKLLQCNGFRCVGYGIVASGLPLKTCLFRMPLRAVYWELFVLYRRHVLHSYLVVVCRNYIVIVSYVQFLDSLRI